VAIPTLTTARLALREWRESDRAPFASLNADPEVVRYLSGPRARARSDALVDEIVAHWAEQGFGLWAVERRADGAFLGFTGLSRPAFQAHFTPAVEVGWRLARHAWGHGYATEAGRAALDYGFEVLDLEEIVSFTVPANDRSRRVMERLGMSRVPADDFDHPRFALGHPLRRHVLYRLRHADRERARAGASKDDSVEDA
jgi:RimJ/RimL family protein N-acetyltransferase